MGVKSSTNYLNMIHQLGYDLSPLEKDTSLFVFEPKVTSYLNSDRLQKLFFSIIRNLTLISGIFAKKPNSDVITSWMRRAAFVCFPDSFNLVAMQTMFIP